MKTTPISAMGGGDRSPAIAGPPEYEDPPTGREIQMSTEPSNERKSRGTRYSFVHQVKKL